MSQVFVVNNQESLSKNPRLAFENILSSMAITTTFNQNDVGYLFDGMTTLKWRTSSINATIDFTGAFSTSNYIGIAGCNWKSSGAELVISSSGNPNIATISNFEDNQPAFILLDSDISDPSLTFSFQNTGSLEVGEIYIGRTVDLPRNVSVGYMPGRWGNDDVESFSRTQGNHFGPSTIYKKGTTEKFTIRYVPVNYLETTYRSFINNAQGLPVFFLWSQESASQVIYGNWEAQRPTFESSFFGSINMTIRGAV